MFSPSTQFWLKQIESCRKRAQSRDSKNTPQGIVGLYKATFLIVVFNGFRSQTVKTSEIIVNGGEKVLNALLIFLTNQRKTFTFEQHLSVKHCL